MDKPTSAPGVVSRRFMLGLMASSAAATATEPSFAAKMVFGIRPSGAVPIIFPGANFSGAAYSGFRSGLNGSTADFQAPAPITVRQGSGSTKTVAGAVLNCADGAIVSQNGRTITIGAGTGDRADILGVRVAIEGGLPVLITQRSQDPNDKTIGYRFQVHSALIGADGTKGKDGWAVGWADIIPVNGYARRIYFRVFLNSWNTYKPVTWYADADLGTDDAGHGIGSGAAACKTISRALYNGALALNTANSATAKAGCFMVRYATGTTAPYLEDYNLPVQLTNMLVEVRPLNDTGLMGDAPSVSAGRASVTRTNQVALDVKCIQQWVPPLKGSTAGVAIVGLYNLDMDGQNLSGITTRAGGVGTLFGGFLYGCTIPNALIDNLPYFCGRAWTPSTSQSYIIGIDGCFDGFWLFGCSGRPYALNTIRGVANSAFTHQSLDFLQMSPGYGSFFTAAMSTLCNRSYYGVSCEKSPVEQVFRDTVNGRTLAQVQPIACGYVSFDAVAAPVAPATSNNLTITLPDGLNTTVVPNKTTAPLYIARFWSSADIGRNTAADQAYHGGSYVMGGYWQLDDGKGTQFLGQGSSGGTGPTCLVASPPSAADTANIAAIAAAGTRVPVYRVPTFNFLAYNYTSNVFVLSGAAKSAYDPATSPFAYATLTPTDSYNAAALAGCPLALPGVIGSGYGSRGLLGATFDAPSQLVKLSSSASGITTVNVGSGSSNHRLLPISRVKLTTLAYLQLTAIPIDGDTLTLAYGGTSYGPFTFKTTVATPASQIAIGGSVSATLSNLLTFLQSPNPGLASTNTFAITGDGAAISMNVTSKTGSAIYGTTALPGASAFTLPASGCMTAFSPYADMGVPTSSAAAPFTTLSNFSTLVQGWLKAGFTDHAGAAITVTSESYVQLYGPVPAIFWYEVYKDAQGNAVTSVSAGLSSAMAATAPDAGIQTTGNLASTAGLAKGDLLICGLAQHPDIQQFNSNQRGDNPMWVESAYMETSIVAGNYQRFQSNGEGAGWGTITTTNGSASFTFVPPTALGTMSLTPTAPLGAVTKKVALELDGSTTWTQDINWSGLGGALYIWNYLGSPRIGTPSCGTLFLKVTAGPLAGTLLQIFSQTTTTTTVVVPSGGLVNPSTGAALTASEVAASTFVLPPPFQQQQILSFTNTDKTGITVNDRLIIQSDSDPMIWTANRPWTNSLTSAIWYKKQNCRSWINHACAFAVGNHYMSSGQGLVDYWEIQSVDTGGDIFAASTMVSCGFIDGLYASVSAYTSAAGTSFQAPPDLTFSGSQIGITGVGYSNAGTTSNAAYAAWIAANDSVTVGAFTVDGSYRPTIGVTKQAAGLLDGTGAALGKLIFPWDVFGNKRTSLVAGAMDQAA